MSSTDLSSFDNSDFRPGSRVAIILWYCCSHLVFTHAWLPFNGLKRSLLRLFGAEIGAGVVIKPKVRIKYPWHLCIGQHSWIGEDVWIDNLGKVDIGAHCCISQGATILSGNHDYKQPSFDLIVKPITLEDGVWIGARSTVVQGIHCASHSILTVGSVAAADLEAYSIYSGVPAVKVRERKMGQAGS